MKVTRVGIGYDVHQLTPAAGGSIPVCGIYIPCDFKVEAHSDGDVGLHALTDAILGAIAKGDIGTHFPPSESKWKGAESKIFLQHAANLVKAMEGLLINVDITIICEEPKIMAHSLKMREYIAQILEISIEQISVKATTTEKMGFLGRKEGIAAQSSCSILVPLFPKSYNT